MSKNWHDRAFFGLHFDIHANQEDIELGRDATVEHLKTQFQKIKPDYVQCDCKGHPGIASYPTKVGVAAKGIVKDALQVWRQATKELGIPLIMHFSGVWDTAAVSDHPDWARIDAKGEPSPHHTCPLSPYTDYMITQMEEIIRNYDVDGFWVDGENWASFPCYCERCTIAFTQATGLSTIPKGKDEPNWKEWLEFSRDNFVDHVRRYTAGIHRVKESCTSCSNWMYTIRQPDDISVDIDYISGDFAWTWSCASAMMEARFMDSRAIKWDLMAWAFTSYGAMENWVFKTVPALCQEAGVVLSCGGAYTIYDTPNRWGTLVDWHMDDLVEVAAFCRARQSYSQDSVSYPQAVLLHNRGHFYAENSPLYGLGETTKPLEGALHAFLENNIHTDIFTDSHAMCSVERYPLCIVPEQTNLSAALVEKLKTYVAKGGTLIVSGVEQTKLFSELLQVEFTGKTVQGYHGTDNVTIEMGRRTAPLLGSWEGVIPKGCDYSKPVLCSRDAGENRRETPFVCASISGYGKGKIAGIYGNLFEKYAISHYPQTRALVGELLDQMAVPGLIRGEAPARIMVTAREKGKTLFVHLVNLGCDQPTNPHNTIVENVPPVFKVKLRIPLAGAPKSVTLAPAGESVHWDFKDGELYATLDTIRIHDILVIERK